LVEFEARRELVRFAADTRRRHEDVAPLGAHVDPGRELACAATNRRPVRRSKDVVFAAARRRRDRADQQVAEALGIVRQPGVRRSIHVDHHESGGRDRDVGRRMPLPPSLDLLGGGRGVVESVGRQRRFATAHARKHRVSQFGVAQRCLKQPSHEAFQMRKKTIVVPY
jgi:hypothetical protein